MALHDHNRYKVVQKSQHLYSHALEEFLFSHPALPPDSINIQDALSYILEVLYPRIGTQVATPADLPTGVDTPNVGDLPPNKFDQILVQDDGDGFAAIYMFYKLEGQPADQWNKVGDLDYGANSVIQGLLDQTQYLFARKNGAQDYDPVTELPLTGKDAGQTLYGGINANENLTLNATVDSVGQTGFVQVNSNFRPYDDLVFNSGTPAERWLNIYAGTAVIGTGTMTITSDAVTGSITDSSGEISFGDENLTTTGNSNATNFTASSNFIVDDSVNTLTIGVSSIISDTGSIDFGNNNITSTGNASATSFVAGTLTVSDGQIVDTDGSISFGATSLQTTGALDAGASTLSSVNVDDIFIDGNVISISTLNQSLDISANGTGVINALSDIFGAALTLSGDLTVQATGNAILNDLTISGSTISSTGDIVVADNILPDVDGTLDLGAAASRYRNIYLGGIISDGTGDYLAVDLMRMSRNAWRDVAKTQPAQDGDVLFYNSLSGKWLASAPDLEIEHSELSGLTTGDAGHTQFVMLAGRTGGQTIYGDDGGGFGNLKLGAQSGDSLAEMTAVSFQPDVDESLQLGGPVNRWTNLYMTGQAFGLRLENTANPAGLFDAADIGRITYNTADEFVYVNTGVSFKRVGNNSHNATYTQIQLQSAINVSADVDDARNCIWQLVDVDNNEEIMGVTIQKSATEVTIANSVALPVGTYRLLGIEV